MKWQTATDTLDVDNVSVAGLSGVARIWPAGGWLMGMTLANLDPANPMHVDIYDGADLTGEFLFTVALGPTATTRQSPGLPGVPLESGLFIDVTAGALTAGFTIGRML